MLVGIAGGSGFVGLAIAEALLQQGAHVLLIDINQPPEAALKFLGAHSGLGALEIQVADVSDAGEAAQALRGIDALVCAAAVTSADARERERPTETLETNILGFTNLLQAARGVGVKRIINLSSASAYGISGLREMEVSRKRERGQSQILYTEYQNLLRRGSRLVFLNFGPPI